MMVNYHGKLKSVHIPGHPTYKEELAGSKPSNHVEEYENMPIGEINELCNREISFLQKLLETKFCLLT